MNDKDLQEPTSDCSIEKKVCINEDVSETVADSSADITEQPMSENSKNIV